MDKEIKEAEIVEEDDLPDLPIAEKPLVPQMNVAPPVISEMETKPCPVSDEKLISLYDEILGGIREDKKEIDDLLKNITDMVLNEGDSTTASKEAMVKLVELKIGAADRMAKVADLMTRVKLKERDTFKPYMQKNEQNNTLVIQEGPPASQRELIKTIHAARKKGAK